MITAVILTKNNESTISKTLQTLLWCDEILVVDDFSSDTTTRIAKKLHAHVYARHLDNDFATQRNFCLEKAKGEWVLCVDSDEIVSENLKREILEKISQGGDHGQGIVGCLLYTSPSPRDRQKSRMPSSA